MVTPDGAPGTLRIHQDVTFYVARLEADSRVTHPLRVDRLGYVFAIGGRLRINDVTLSEGDTARIGDTGTLELHAEVASELLLIDLPRV